MLETTLVFGVVIFLGIAAVLIKLPLLIRLRLLGHALALDIGVAVAALIIHWGTMTGLMSATVCGLICAAVTSIARKSVGYIRGNHYYPGKINLKQRVLREHRLQKRLRHA